MDDHNRREGAFWDEAYRRQPLGPDTRDPRRLGLLYALEPYLYSWDYFFAAIGHPAGKRVLSIGGGIDGTALWLADRGADVSCLDLAANAMATTRALAEQAGLARRVTCHVGRCEEMTFTEAFDIVVVRKALHHLALPESLAAIRAALTAAGVLIAYEPVCLSGFLSRMHRRFPFHPDYPVQEAEHELSRQDLDSIEAAFPCVEYHYFDLLTRPSLAYCVGRLGLRRALRPLGLVDFHIIESIPWLKRLSSSVVIKATARAN